MEDDATERHTYLMFVYTTTIATLAALFASQILEKFPLLCMMPLMIIVPFQARISYSRLTHAKIEAYVYVFYLPRFEFLEKQVKDLRGVIGKLIAIAINYELSFLVILLDIFYLYFQKEEISIRLFLRMDWVVILLATIFVVFLATYTFSYSYFWKKYIKEYEKMRMGEWF